MNKISVDELDQLLFSKGAEEVTGVNPEQTSEKSSKEPALRKPIDALTSAVNTVAGGAAATVAGLSKVKTNMPMTEIK